MQPNRSWLPLLLGILFCTFVGGGLRVLFAPDVVAKWVHSLVEKKETRFYFNFKKAQISLSKGWTPHFAIELTDVEFGAKDSCVSSSKLRADQLIIPLKLSALMNQNVQFGHVQVGELAINLRQRDGDSNCPKDTAEFDGNLNSEIQNIEKFLSTRWKKEINNTLRYLTEFSVDNLRLAVNDQLEPLFQLENVQLKFNSKSGEGYAEFIFWPGLAWAAGQPFGPTQTRINVSEQDVSWQGESNLKEGQIHFNGAWQIEKSQITSHLNWIDVPLSNLVALFDRWGLMNIKEFHPRNQWGTCSITTDGNIREWQNLKFSLNECSSKGDLGEFYFKTVGLFLTRAESYPMTVEFKKVNLKAVLDAYAFPLFKNLSHYGEGKGLLTWPEKNKWKIEGDIVGAEIFMSLLDPNRRLEVGPAQLEVNYKDGYLVGHIRSANSLGLGAQAELQFEKMASSDALNMVFSLDINEAVEPPKKHNILPYRELKLNLQAKTDYHDFYNVKGSIVLNDIVLKSDDAFYPVAAHLSKSAEGEAQPQESIHIQKSVSRFAILSNKNLFSEGQFEITQSEKTVSFKYEVLLQDRLFESGKITRLASDENQNIYILRGSLQKPLIQ